MEEGVGVIGDDIAVGGGEGFNAAEIEVGPGLSTWTACMFGAINCWNPLKTECSFPVREEEEDEEEDDECRSLKERSSSSTSISVRTGPPPPPPFIHSCASFTG